MLEGQPTPRRIRALVVAPVVVELTRIDVRTLRARLDDGMMTGIFGDLFRAPSRPLRVGKRVELGGMSVLIEAVTVDGRPREIVFRFGLALEDPSMRWQDGLYGPCYPHRT